MPAVVVVGAIVVVVVEDVVDEPGFSVVGEGVIVVGGADSWKALCLPKQLTVPDCSTQVCSTPRANDVAPVTACTRCGTEVDMPVVPSCPFEFWPQQ